MKNYTFILAAIMMVLLGCRKDDIATVQTDADFADWSESSHGSSTDPNYSIVFNQNEVLRFDIKISEGNWSAMQADLAENIGSSGGGPGGGGGNFSDFDPVWVASSLHFNGIEWYNVGIRYKGNSSLSSAYQQGNNKLSFKLDFDEFEEYSGDYTNQRFYGFRQLNLNNNYNDPSLMREKVGADLFRQFGLASAQTAFCVLYIDHGNGPQYFGVYALVEEVDDTVLDSQFADGSGNLYKPDGDAATFASGTFDEGEMEIKTNIESANYADVEALYNIVNSNDRTSNTEQWKSDLEKIFNVDGYMKWLAANIVIQNWDTYGRMSHNYYLYNNPTDNKLTWIPWDNNEAFQEGKQGGALKMNLNEVGTNWPLIRYLKDVEAYNELYETYLQQFIDDVFIPANMISTYDQYYLMLKDYADAEVAGYTFIQYDAQFDQAVETLKTHVQERNDAVILYLN